MTASRILVVDDEADIRDLMQEILTDEGYEVEVAADARAARAARAARVPDLVMLDIWMPDTDGISLLREWSERNATGLSGGDDVGARHHRNRGRGDPSRRLRLRRKAAVAHQAAAHRGARPGCRPAQADATRIYSATHVRAGRQGKGAPGAARADQRASRRAIHRSCWSANWARDARPTRATSIAVGPRREAVLHGRSPRASARSRGDAVRQRARRPHRSRARSSAPTAARCTSTDSKT